MFGIAVQLINPSRSRAKQLSKALRDGNEVSEAVPEFNLNSSDKLLTLLCLEKRNSISHVCWGRRTQKAGTALVKLNIERILGIYPIVIDDIIDAGYVSDYLDFFSRSMPFSGVGDAYKLVEILKFLSKDIKEFIDMSIKDYALIDQLDESQRSIIRMQQDATEFALRMAHINPHASYIWSPTKHNSERVDNFFSGLRPSLKEDDVVRWDARRIPGYQLLEDRVFGYVILEDNRSKLHVFHANKNALEHTTGVDLIYFNEEHKSFIFVQYKMMDVDGKPKFRFPQDQLNEEINRMDRMWEVILQKGHISDAHEYRLIENPFFLKFCPRDDFNPDRHNQIQGMIIPREYWTLIAADSSENFLGPRGGSQLTFENCPKYLDNTQFINFLQDGWIGTGVLVHPFLETVVQEIINTGQSLIFAAKLAEQSVEPEPKARKIRRKKGKTRSRGPT